jgi:ribosomal protein L13E
MGVVCPRIPRKGFAVPPTQTSPATSPAQDGASGPSHSRETNGPVTCLKQLARKIPCWVECEVWLAPCGPDSPAAGSQVQGPAVAKAVGTLWTCGASKGLSRTYWNNVDGISVTIVMTTWHKRDWQQFYELARRPWQRHRPPRPVYPTGLNRVLPAQGFSLSELDDAGVDLDLAERLGLPVDAGRIGAYGPNVTVLRDFVRSSRQPR